MIDQEERERERGGGGEDKGALCPVLEWQH